MSSALPSQLAWRGDNGFFFHIGLRVKYWDWHYWSAMCNTRTIPVFIRLHPICRTPDVIICFQVDENRKDVHPQLSRVYFGYNKYPEPFHFIRDVISISLVTKLAHKFSCMSYLSGYLILELFRVVPFKSAQNKAMLANGSRILIVIDLDNPEEITCCLQLLFVG